MNVKEWSDKNKWNPFNSHKLLTHVERWQHISRINSNGVPHPALVTIDPVNRCNLSCSWCNSELILQERDRIIEHNLLMEIGSFLSEWKSSYKTPGVLAICLAGGGEPLLHPKVGDFIQFVSSCGIEVGIVTNGIHIDRFVNSLSECTWVGVSIDAGSKEGYLKNKGLDVFDKVLSNINILNEHAYRNNRRLGADLPGYGITYKFLLHPSNYLEVYSAIEKAYRSGCKQFHMRPYGTPWNLLGKDKLSFNFTMQQNVNNQIEKARKDFETDDFRIYGISHKFDESFSVSNHFSKCYALFMTGVIMPGSNRGYTLGLCCDRRGDKNLELLTNSTNPYDIQKFWGGRKHWDIFDSLKVDTCPRCTYQPHNQIYENVILKDSMTWKFI